MTQPFTTRSSGESGRTAVRAIRHHRAPRGFTLAEILAALAVLVMGLAAVLTLFYGSFKEGHVASDRNAAALLIAEAVRQVEEEHSITAGPTTGLFVETIESSSGPTVSDDDPAYADMLVENQSISLKEEDESTVHANLNEWPRRPAKPYYVGGVPQANGAPFRVRYRLEKHPNWQPDPLQPELAGSPFRGLYVLTLACYRDTDQKMNQRAQVSDPVVVYLRDRK